MVGSMDGCMDKCRDGFRVKGIDECMSAWVSV